MSGRNATVRTFGLQRQHVVLARTGASEPSPYLVCPHCGNELTGFPEVITVLDGAPCFSMRCAGTFQQELRRDNYYRSLYNGNMLRVVSREHTSLLPSQTRLEYEDQFKSSETTPGAPNVLVATPTLEMGIDIGDLSTVVLSSIPRTVASYLQRVGRAGRKTGNALDLSFVSTRVGRPETDPTELINGSVRPPAAYLSAEELLHRQYLAFLMDRLAGDPGTPDPGAKPVLRSTDPGSYLHALLEDANRHAENRLDEFLSSFRVEQTPQAGITQDAVRSLRGWATPVPGAQSELEKTVHHAVRRWNAEKDQIRFRMQAIQKRRQDLEAGGRVLTDADQEMLNQLKGQEDLLRQHDVELNALDDSAAREKELRKLTGQQHRTQAEHAALMRQHWVSALESFGLLPNFTLFDDSVDLDVTLTWRDDEGGFRYEPRSYARSGFGALTELAPGNHFYAQGYDVVIDSVDLGMDKSGLRRTAFCPQCGHQHVLASAEDEVHTCPHCKSAGIADPGQHLDVVDLTKVSSTADRNQSAIGDSSDDRTRVRFTTRLVPDFNQASTLQNWSIDGTGIGIHARRGTKLTQLNLGRPLDGGQEILLAGSKERYTGFLICAECGHQDEDTSRNRGDEHQPWCSQRAVEDPEAVSVVLARSIVTESVLVSVPQSIGEDTSGKSLWSLGGALMLGLRELFGGDVSHLSLAVIIDTSRRNAPALLIYDSVPGGTGYLSELAAPDSFRAILQKSADWLEDCSCQEEDLPSCNRCLLPFVPADRQDVALRSRALEILGQILSPEADQDAEERPWSITQAAPPLEEDLDSKLESRFYRIFRAEAEKISGAQLSESEGDGGKGFSLFRDGMKYTYTPQMQIGGVQPDACIIMPGNQQYGRAAIFLDGKAFHATAKNNRLADDAQKRQRLRDLGYLVFAVTDQDLNDFEARKKEGTAQTSVLDELLSPWALKVLSEGNHLTPEVREYLTRNPVDQLLDLFRTTPQKDPLKVQTTASELLVPALLDRKSRFPVNKDTLLTDALQFLDDAARGPLPPAPRGQHLGFRMVDPPLAVLGHMVKSYSLVMVLDDRPEAFALDHFDTAWRQWLKLANLAQPLSSGFRIETWSSLTSARSEDAESAEDAVLRALNSASEDLGSAPESSLHADLFSPADKLSPEYEKALQKALDEEEKQVLRASSAAGAPLPEQGPEVGGIIVDLFWEQGRLAWIADAASVEEARELDAFAGWRVLGPEPEPAIQALRDLAAKKTPR